jgi:hypothetical protein
VLIKRLFSVVILMFAVVATLDILGGSAMIMGLKTPGNPQTARYEEIVDGSEAVGFGIAYGIAAFGLYKRNSLARFLVLVLVIWNLFGALSDVFSDPGLVSLFWLCATIFVPACLFSSSIRAEFAAVRTEEKAA